MNEPLPVLGPLPFSSLAADIRRLAELLPQLHHASAALQISPLVGRDWYDLLERKLIPQLARQTFLVVAVVGGTNIGKSVIFNHLAGDRISATSPLASGTKHPVCLVPAGFAETHDLAAIFPGFQLTLWSDPAAPLENCAEHRLFWKTDARLPTNMLVLDSPDIDSDAEINWLRADYLRQSADVLLAVLTQQKYNDAAVKQFFRKAAAEDKAIVVVFNQCLLPEDEQFWPLWLETFCRETGISPDLLYLAPNNRLAAEENRLPFLERHWPRSPTEPPPDLASPPKNLARDLTEMRFAEIKLRTLRGALSQLLSTETGAPSYLIEIQLRSENFQAAGRLLSTQELARIENWPAPPAGLLVTQIREWWRTHRTGFTKTIHDFYGQLGAELSRPFRWIGEKIGGKSIDPRKAYIDQERQVMLLAVEKLYDELTRLSQLGNELLKPRLDALLAGASRAELVQQLTAALDNLDLTRELEEVVESRMENFRAESPNTFGLFRKLDAVAATVRPMSSVVSLYFGGVMGHTLIGAQSLAVHVFGDIATGTGAAAVGETALTGMAGGLRLLETRFRELQAAFTERRVAWFARFLHDRILGNLHAELTTAGNLPQSAEFQEISTLLDRLSRQFSPPAPERGLPE